MKRKFIYSSMIFLCLNCNNPTEDHQPVESIQKVEASEEEKVLKKAEEIAFKEYGNVIKNELPLKARLLGDSVWVIEGTLPSRAVGGTVYIELRRSDFAILKMTHYK